MFLLLCNNIFFCWAFIFEGSEKKREKLSSSVRAVRKGTESKDLFMLKAFHVNISQHLPYKIYSEETVTTLCDNQTTSH